MPDDIRRLAQEFLHDPVTVKIGKTLPAQTVSHALYPVAEHLKTDLLKGVLHRIDSESVLVFTRTKRRAQRVADQLRRAGFRATSLQGDMSQPQRQAAFDGFRSGSYKVMVATDIAARGIDVLSISHVVNYDMPDCTDSYIHRIGRTGRINQDGEAMTFATGRDAAAVRDLEKLLNRRLDRCTLPDFDYDAPAPERDRVRGPRVRGAGRRFPLPVRRVSAARS
jgi:ATP-dependent RNA helicase RhlE